MHTTRALLRPLSHHVLTGAGVRTLNPQHMHMHKRSILTLKDHVYFSKATAEGPGRNGTVKSFGDSPLELKMAMPKTAGGKGDGQNPEQLFAMGYASCFLGALQLAASRHNKMEVAEKAKVTVNVFLGHPSNPDMDGFALRAEVNVEGCLDDEIITDAHEFCPYSRALKHGAEVTIKKV